jgi:L-alanine-DL-glutamate epimerase-like enolase superfamily enzyme
MAQTAKSYAGAQAIKLKLTGTPNDAERVRAVRAARPEAWLGVDANQGFTRASLADLMPVLVDARVGLIEQPFPIGREADLDGLRSPIPIAADESAQDLKDVAGLVGRFDIVNIKLDKSGGLTEALAMARQAHALGLGVMVGNMTGTALAMAPAGLVGQLCRIVDLDGPIFLRNDRSPGAVYENGTFWCPPEVWGGGARSK